MHLCLAERPPQLITGCGSACVQRPMTDRVLTPASLDETPCLCLVGGGELVAVGAGGGGFRACLAGQGVGTEAVHDTGNSLLF